VRSRGADRERRAESRKERQVKAGKVRRTALSVGSGSEVCTVTGSGHEPRDVTEVEEGEIVGGECPACGEW
jgi:hypothetical protein